MSVDEYNMRMHGPSVARQYASCNRPPRDRSQAYVVLNDVLGTVSGVFVFQRLAYKLWAKMGFGGDDCMTFVTFLTGLPSTVISAYGVTNHGLGRDIWTLTPSQITRFGLFFWILEVLYFVQVSMVKVTLLLFYIRIFPGRTVRLLLWGTLVGSAIFGVAFFFAAIFQCTPVKYYWHKWDGEHRGTCLDINSIAWSNAAISIVTDIWVLAIPLWQLKSLNLDWRRKLGVGMMFCVGAFVTVVSVLRLRSIIKFGSDSLNPTWDFYDVSFWSALEINVGLICVCLPSFRVLLVRFFPRLQGTTERYYGRSSRRNRSTTNKRTSRLPLGHSAGSHVDRSQPHPNVEPNRIAYQTSYTVEYGYNDEVQLVSMNDKQSSRSDITSDVS
ncbi:putative PTH11-type G-protein coupled receptor protein [Trichoderma cornu-damae]|uniref:PTH11-type G-protein coupled receptor protein n=1 Tax=Trichoderma cornu-damae TaxID=654480 RepID=A0A9P8QV40_9HYPO|nr:putative PTH11-type G-protein coupled receptor protein [Trichoderma cornu-damae]